MEQRVMAALRDAFKPEFLHRIDEIIIFNSLGREEIKATAPEPGESKNGPRDY
jgi:ATP-dependent Clp protease ATP-binding subunit ClpA